MELYKPTRSKRKTKTPKRISGNSTKMKQKNEITNLEFKRTDSNSSSYTTFSSKNQEIQFQIDFDSSG
jgi:hypothetical protein